MLLQLRLSWTKDRRTLPVAASSKLVLAATGLLFKECMQVHVLPLAMLGFVTAWVAESQRNSSRDRLFLMLKHLKLSLSMWWQAQLRQLQRFEAVDRKT